MNDPRQMAVSLLGPVAWETDVSGFCRCPGERLHTHPNGPKDCRVSVDGAPTVHCFHASCAEVVAATNQRLRRELGAMNWELKLANGQVLRSGDVCQRDGTVLPWTDIVGHTSSGLRPPSPQGGEGERLVLESVRVLAERFKPELFERFHWPFAQIVEDSPLWVAERDAEDQFRTWLKLWPAHCHVWIGDIYSSGRPEHRTHFRSVAEWYQVGPVMGNFTCGSSFKAGSYRRCNENLNGQRFLVVESDTLDKDVVGAVFAYLNRRLHFNLHAIIDTAGKSLHGWFDAPRDKRIEARLKAMLTVFGCDPKLFTYSQPVRVPGAWRDGRLQRIVWLRN
jgi:hypothetical protein